MKPYARIRSFTSKLLGTLLLGIALPSLTWAIPTGSHYMVSPASCQPSEGDGVSAATSVSKLELINGVWTFRSNQTGTAVLTCPINFSGADGEWSLIQLWYRDDFYDNEYPPNGYVQADLMRRNRHEAGSTMLAWTASTYGNGAQYGFDTNESLPSGPHNFQMYYVKVRLHRTTTNGEVAFVGFEIRFE